MLFSWNEQKQTTPTTSSSIGCFDSHLKRRENFNNSSHPLNSMWLTIRVAEQIPSNIHRQTYACLILCKITNTFQQPNAIGILYWKMTSRQKSRKKKTKAIAVHLSLLLVGLQLQQIRSLSLDKLATISLNEACLRICFSAIKRPLTVFAALFNWLHWL